MSSFLPVGVWQTSQKKDTFFATWKIFEKIEKNLRKLKKKIEKIENFFEKIEKKDRNTMTTFDPDSDIECSSILSISSEESSAATSKKGKLFFTKKFQTKIFFLLDYSAVQYF